MKTMMIHSMSADSKPPIDPSKVEKPPVAIVVSE